MHEKIHIPEHIRIVCVMCKKAFIPEARPDGIPNGVGFQTADGMTVNVCSSCIMKLGEEEIAHGNRSK